MSASTAEAITNPRFGQDVLRLGRIGFDFLSQVSNKHSQIVGLIAIVRTPYRLQQLPVRHGFAGMRHEITQKIELFGSEANGFLSGPDLPRFEVDFEIARCECVWTRHGGCRRPPESCPNTSK